MERDTYTVVLEELIKTIKYHGKEKFIPSDIHFYIDEAERLAWDEIFGLIGVEAQYDIDLENQGEGAVLEAIDFLLESYPSYTLNYINQNPSVIVDFFFRDAVYYYAEVMYNYDGDTTGGLVTYLENLDFDF